MNTTTASTAGLSRARQQRTLVGALPFVARAIGRRMNIEIRIGGHEAHTDRRSYIQLPTLPFEDPEVETLAFGYLEHEAAHIRYTQDIEIDTPVLHRLWNTIEDIRAERELGREYPGFGSDLGRLVTKLVQDGTLERPSVDDPPGVMLRRYLSYRLRAEVLHQQGIAEYAEQAETLFRTAFPAGACVRLGSIIGRVPTLQSAQDSLALATEILTILKEESEEPPPPPAAPDTAGSGNDAQNALDPTASNALPPDDSATDATQPMPDPDAQRRTLLRQLLEDPDPDLGPELSESVGEALQGAAQEAVRREGSGGGFGRADQPIAPPAGDPEQTLLAVHEASVALRTRLKSLVESVRYNRRTYRRHGTRIAPERLVRAMLGDARMFSARRLGVGIDTALEILCDRSGSMAENERLRVATRSTLAVASGLSNIRGIALETAVFPGARYEVEVLTGFDESLRATATRYDAVGASGGTPMYEALAWGLDRLVMRREPRKILLCLTDGEPPAITREACQNIIAAARASGIEVYAIGIRVPDITDLFPVARSIKDVSELASAMFEVLQSALTGACAA